MLSIALPPTVSGLAKVAIFTTNVDAENQTLNNHKCVCGALNRHFCQTRVIGWRSLSVVGYSHFYVVCLCHLSSAFLSGLSVGCFIFFLKRWRFFKNNFSFGLALQALLKTLDVCWLVRFLIVLANCVGYSLFSMFFAFVKMKSSIVDSILSLVGITSIHLRKPNTPITAEIDHAV